MLTKQQQYWTLNGNFEALHIMLEALTEGKITTMSELQNQIVRSMELIHERMSKLEKDNELKKQHCLKEVFQLN